MKTIERIILSNLINNEEYCRKVLPFLKEEYFGNEPEKIVFKTIGAFVLKYDTLPKIESISIDLSNENIFESHYEEIDSILKDIETCEKEGIDWLIDNSEKFCKDKALYNAIVESIDIIDGKSKNKISKEGIPSLLQDALSVCFNSSVGHDYIEDSEERFKFYISDEERIEFDIDILNKITKGGLTKKTLNIIMAGCVHPETKVLIRCENEETNVSIYYIKKLLKDHKKVEIFSPDGFVNVKKYVQKGKFEEYELTLDDGRIVKCNGDHLFETTLGWQFAKDLVLLPEQHYLTDDGYVLGFIEKTDEIIDIVDIEVEHDNHRYYANGVSSHNTNVGKSMMLCHLAAAYMYAKKNVLYITLEMAEERIAERIDANLLNVDINNIKNLEQGDFISKINKLYGKSNSKLIIKEYPPVSSHVGHFEHLLNELKIKKSFEPDVLIVDYLNIMASQRSTNVTNSYSYIKAIAEELRGLAVKHKIPVISATQVNRCLSLDAVVYTPSGKKLIKDIKVGDKVLSTGNIWINVLKVYPIEKQTAYRIQTDKTDIVCSSKHMFPSTDGNLYSISGGLNNFNFLTENMNLLGGDYDYNSKTLTEYINRIEEVVCLGEIDTIDISCDGNNLFYANGILTHNSGFNSSDIDMTDVSESFGLSFTADLMLALISSDEMENLGQLMIKQVKNRYGDKNYYNKFVVGIDRSRMRLYDLEDSAQKEIVYENKVSDRYEDMKKPEKKNPFDKTKKYQGFKV